MSTDVRFPFASPVSVICPPTRYQSPGSPVTKLGMGPCPLITAFAEPSAPRVTSLKGFAEPLEVVSVDWR
jgi:hypothetical protein